MNELSYIRKKQRGCMGSLITQAASIEVDVIVILDFL